MLHRTEHGHPREEAQSAQRPETPEGTNDAIVSHAREDDGEPSECHDNKVQLCVCQQVDKEMSGRALVTRGTTMDGKARAVR